MKLGRYTLTDLAKNEMFDYAQYTVERRAIPNMIDSLKPVQRFYLIPVSKTVTRNSRKSLLSVVLFQTMDIITVKCLLHRLVN